MMMTCDDKCAFVPAADFCEITRLWSEKSNRQTVEAQLM